MQFHLEQAKARTQQRLREGRPKPIDIIVRNLYFPDDVDADGADPYEIAKSLTLPELRGLADDVQDYQVRRMLGHRRALSCLHLGARHRGSFGPLSLDHVCPLHGYDGGAQAEQRGSASDSV